MSEASGVTRMDYATGARQRDPSDPVVEGQVLEEQRLSEVLQLRSQQQRIRKSQQWLRAQVLCLRA